MLDDIRKARESKGLSRRALAQSLGLPEKTIGRIEAGQGRVDHLIRIMEAVDYHVAGLAAGHDFPSQLRNRRAKMGLSIVNLSSRSGLAWHTIAALEEGRGTIASLTKLMAVIGRNVRRRAPERAHWAVDRKHGRDARFTPPEFLAKITDAFGPIDLDTAGHPDAFVQSARAFHFDDRGEDGLALPWSAQTVWCNPPYSAQLQWVKKAHAEYLAGRAKTIIMLVPARTDSRFFHDELMLVADVGLLRGRIKFLSPDGKLEQTPFALMLIIMGASTVQMDRLRSTLDATWLPRSSKSDPSMGQILTIAA